MTLVRHITFSWLFFVSFYSFAQSSANWEPDIQVFEQQDSVGGYNQGGIMFIGSSSIKLWKTLAADMAPHSVIQHGFGGSSLPDVIQYAERIIGKHKPCAFVLFVANDIKGAANDKSPDQVASLHEDLVSIIRSQHAHTQVFILAITPTGSRWQAWPRIQSANKAIADMTLRQRNVTLIPTEHLFLGVDGMPDPALFVADKLHLSPAGYTRWTSVLRPLLHDAIITCD
jgi:lysophospholipase L1-like esterase